MKTDHRAWGFRRAENGEVEARLFEEGRPDGWADSPARVDDAPAAPKRRRARKDS